MASRYVVSVLIGISNILNTAKNIRPDSLIKAPSLREVMEMWVSNPTRVANFEEEMFKIILGMVRDFIILFGTFGITVIILAELVKAGILK